MIKKEFSFTYNRNAPKQFLSLPFQVACLPRTSVYYPHSVQPSPLLRSSDDDDPGSRSPPLEVSDEESMRDHISSTTGVEHGEDPLIFSIQYSTVKGGTLAVRL